MKTWAVEREFGIEEMDPMASERSFARDERQRRSDGHVEWAAGAEYACRESIPIITVYARFYRLWWVVSSPLPFCALKVTFATAFGLVACMEAKKTQEEYWSSVSVEHA